TATRTWNCGHPARSGIARSPTRTSASGCVKPPERPREPGGRPRRAIRSRVRNRLERVRKTSAALATLSLAVLTLTGCTAAPSFDGAACERSASDSGIDDLATVSGEVGEEPRVEVFTPVRTDQTSYSDLIVGSGPALTEPTQGAVIEFVLYSGETG